MIFAPYVVLSLLSARFVMQATSYYKAFIDIYFSLLVQRRSSKRNTPRTNPFPRYHLACRECLNSRVYGPLKQAAILLRNTRHAQGFLNGGV